jgi:hypothetical protein
LATGRLHDLDEGACANAYSVFNAGHCHNGGRAGGRGRFQGLCPRRKRRARGGSSGGGASGGDTLRRGCPRTGRGCYPGTQHSARYATSGEWPAEVCFSCHHELRLTYSNRPVGVVTGARIFASPLARKVASERGIALAEVAGTGPNGRIIVADVESFVPGTISAFGGGLAPALPS